MREYQQQAIELGFLHDRYLRGTAPPDVAAARLCHGATGCARCVPTSGSRRRGRQPALAAATAVGQRPGERGRGDRRRRPRPTELVDALTGCARRWPASRCRSTCPARRSTAPPAREMVDQLEDYVLPRLIQIEAPLLTVVGGSTGAGKSTLVNSLVGRRVTEPGVLRPDHPLAGAGAQPRRRGLVRQGAHPARPGPHRRRRPATRARCSWSPTTSVPEGLAILDAPDIDSVEERNRTLAAELLAAADLWLFVTSAARYADQVPWDFLQAAAERSTAVAIVLDRTAPEAVEEVSGHLARMLVDRGLRDSPLFTVTEGAGQRRRACSARSRSPRSGSWLDALAADATHAAAVVRQTLDGAVRSLVAAHPRHRRRGRTSRSPWPAGCAPTSTGPTTRRSARSTTRRPTAPCCAARCWPAGRSSSAPASCSRSLETKVGWLRDRRRRLGCAASRSRPSGSRWRSSPGLETLILEHAESAAERAEASWRSVTAGPAPVEDSGRDLGRASRDFRARAERAVRDWQHGVLELVRQRGRGQAHHRPVPGVRRQRALASR